MQRKYSPVMIEFILHDSEESLAGIPNEFKRTIIDWYNVSHSIEIDETTCRIFYAGYTMLINRDIKYCFVQMKIAENFHNKIVSFTCN